MYVLIQQEFVTSKVLHQDMKHDLNSNVAQSNCTFWASFDMLEWRPFQVEDLRARGFEPYGYTWDRTHTAAELQEKYVDLPSATEANEEKDQVSVAGRIIARRVFGKLAFLTLRDDSGDIQV